MKIVSEGLRNKNILVTGASSELGVALVKNLTELGSNLTLTTSSDEGLKTLSRFVKLGAKLIKVDLTKINEVVESELNDKYDVVFHLVGGYKASSVKKYKSDELSYLLSQMVVSTANLMEKVKEGVAQRGGRVIYISTRYKVSANNTAYVVSKRACEIYLEGVNDYFLSNKADDSERAFVQIYRIKQIGENGSSVESIVKKLIEGYKVDGFISEIEEKE